MARSRARIAYLVAWLLALGGTLRYLEYILGHPSRWAILGLLVAFFALLATVPWLSLRSHQRMHLYLCLQTCILLSLTIITTIEDFAAIPCMSLILIAMTIFTPRIGFRWIGAFIVILPVSMIAYGSMYHGINAERILPNALLYITIYLAAGAVIALAHQLKVARSEAEAARREGEELLAELQVAHQQLQAKTGQADELAVIAERNGLARNLHDSVSQTVFSITLSAEAAGILFDLDPARAASEPDKREALAKMRSLVLELRPTAEWNVVGLMFLFVAAYFACGIDGPPGSLLSPEAASRCIEAAYDSALLAIFFSVQAWACILVGTLRVLRLAPSDQ